MQIDDDRLAAAWRQAIEDYRRTPLATKYAFAPTKALFRQLQAVAAHVPDGGTLLDIGTGMAIMPRTMKRLGARVITVDPPASGRAALDNAALADIETHVCDVTERPLPLADASVDCVLFADVIEHLYNSPKPALAEFHRVLKPGGVVVSTTVNAVRLPARIKLLLGWSTWPPLADFYDESHHYGHHHEYTPEEFRQAFERAGFGIDALRLHGTSSDIETVGFERLSGAAARDRPNPLVGLAKHGMGLIEQLAPRLRRDMLIVARRA